MNSEELRLTKPPQLIREQAFDRLKQAITTGYFAPGARLIERELCEAMGVSRTSIREVLRRLEAERLIKVEPRRGPVVAQVTRDEAEEIYRIRAHLESLLLARFVKRASDQDIDKLGQIIDEMGRDVGHELLDVVQDKARFYDHIMAVANSEIISEIVRQLIARISFLRATSMSEPGRMNASIKEMQEIVLAAKNRDVHAVVKAAKKHIQNARISALTQIEKLEIKT